ncbi:hypothetical protein PL11201_290009 [Planktothrix sp. PCC 11201]|uniref:hypothetical protein n=1 Tax=Planktothrix sp. PCC 11201 TaxID=1729650 RepID=UPI00091773B8|nr:hypothetical protein [Planktothrix sp. PCC 11201]SKB12041.1 hypothetical protein PL11201_290009 [Planktothrix sp. PCC 11201]
MKIRTIKLKHCDLWSVSLSRDINLCLSFFSLKALIIKPEFFTKGIMGSQITTFNLFTLSIQLITPRLFFWVNDNKLINLAVNILHDRALELQDYQVDYLLGNIEYNAEKMADCNAESSVLWNLINFYGVNKEVILKR